MHDILPSPNQWFQSWPPDIVSNADCPDLDTQIWLWRRVWQSDRWNEIRYDAAVTYKSHDKKTHHWSSEIILLDMATFLLAQFYFVFVLAAYLWRYLRHARTGSTDLAVTARMALIMTVTTTRGTRYVMLVRIHCRIGMLLIVAGHLKMVSSNEGRRYICNVFPHWMRSFSGPTRLASGQHRAHFVSLWQRFGENSTQWLAYLRRIICLWISSHASTILFLI